MKILLLNPPTKRPSNPEGLHIIREELAAGYHNEKILPAQMFLVASYMKRHGRDIDLLDAENYDVEFGGYDVVVVWASTLFSLYDDLELFEKAKENDAKTVLILNDSYDNFETEIMQRNPFIDAAILLWEREFTLNKLISCWERRENPNLPGVVYRKGSDVINMGELPPFSNLEHLEPYADLLENFKLDRYTSLAVIPGRGCPVECTFCKYRNTPVRKRRLEDVISELNEASTSINKALIVDPAFTEDATWIKRFTNAIAKENLEISWRTDVRAERCTLDILRMMHMAGCDEALMGIETLDSSIAERIKAGVQPEILDKAVRNLRSLNIIPMLCFYLGFAWDSDATLNEIRVFLKNHSIPWFQLRYARPWKGTLYYAECQKLGLVSRELSIDDYVNSANPLIDTLYLSRQEVIGWKEQITRTAVRDPRFLIWALREGRPVTSSGVKAFLKAFTTRKLKTQ